MTATTLIRKVDWVVAWRETKSSHVHLRNVDVAFLGTAIPFAGIYCEEEVS